MYCGFWALLTPFILWLAKRYRLERNSWLPRLLFHTFVASALAILQRAVYQLIVMLVRRTPDAPFDWDRFSRAVFGFFDYGLHIYFVILFISHALEYYKRYQEQQLLAEHLKSELASAELQTLKMQLHPHFLFNTLHSIAMLVRKNANSDAIRMITGLSKLLRYTLKTFVTQDVPVRQELELMKLYLDIQQTRFKKRLQVKLDIARDVGNARLPIFILQPLLENAILHGIAPKAEGGQIEIRVERKNAKLCIQISDDGTGLKDDWQRLKRNGIGLRNTEARLKKFYGEGYSFEAINRNDGGTTVNMKIPFNEVDILELDDRDHRD